jgi:molybdopterin adenylyltransferase
MMKPDDKKRFRAAVVTVSDKGAAGEREDKSGAVVREALQEAGIEVVRTRIVPDELEELKALLGELCDSGLNLVVTTGGTGLSPRDVTPEATAAVVEREVPGMAEAMRAASLKITPHAMISRATCGLKGGTLIINLPGSPSGARECLDVVMPAVPHALEVAAGEASECATEQPKNR